MGTSSYNAYVAVANYRISYNSKCLRELDPSPGGRKRRKDLSHGGEEQLVQGRRRRTEREKKEKVMMEKGASVSVRTKHCLMNFDGSASAICCLSQRAFVDSTYWLY